MAVSLMDCRERDENEGAAAALATAAVRVNRVDIARQLSAQLGKSSCAEFKGWNDGAYRDVARSLAV